MPFLSPNQQCQSTEGVVVQDTILKKKLKTTVQEKTMALRRLRV